LQLPDQIDLFGAGMLAAYVYVKFGHRTAEPRVRAWATAAAILATATGLWLINDFSNVTQAGGITGRSVWENDRRFAVSLTIAAIALGSLFAQGWWRAIVACPPLVWLSTISYNLYLWHDSIVTQCQVSGFPCAGRVTPWATINPWNQQYFVGYTVVSIAIATLMTYAVERPLLKMGTRGAYERFIRDPLRALARRAASRPP
jgi:peptidoglycan/LPS O-acetylase OafA/YrhL